MATRSSHRLEEKEKKVRSRPFPPERAAVCHGKQEMMPFHQVHNPRQHDEWVLAFGGCVPHISSYRPQESGIPIYKLM